MSKRHVDVVPWQGIESVIQVNSNREELGPEEAHGGGISGASRYLTGQPALALDGIIVGQQMCCAGTPPSAEPVSQLQSNAWVALDIEDISRLPSMLCHDPELPAKASVADWSVAQLSAGAANRFEERIAGRGEAHRKHKLNWRIE